MTDWNDIRTVVGALQLNNFTLAGHSTGGAIAIRYMARYIGYGVSKLVLIDAVAPIGFTKENANKFLTETLNDRPKMMRGVTDTFFFQDITGPFSDCFFQLGLLAAGWSTMAIIISLRDEKLYADLQKIFVPTLIIHGIHSRENDTICTSSGTKSKNKKFLACPVPIQRSWPFLGRTRQV
jgi:non-heme chloroperoxidase